MTNILIYEYCETQAYNLKIKICYPDSLHGSYKKSNLACAGLMTSISSTEPSLIKSVTDITPLSLRCLWFEVILQGLQQKFILLNF